MTSAKTFVLFALAAIAAGQACATHGDAPAATGGGSDGEGAASATTSASGGGSGVSGGSGGGGGVASSCGNGTIEPPETCDGDDLGGKSCADFGLNPGALACNATCQLVVSGCGLRENCQNGLDDDDDGAVDCFDEECADVASCIDSCAEPLSVVLPLFDLRSTVGRPSSLGVSCAPTSSSEFVYRVVPATSGALGVTVTQHNGDFSVAAFSSCGDAEAELACASATSNPAFEENLRVAVEAGKSYFVVIDALSATDSGAFQILMRMVPDGETSCQNLVDDDADGLLDCADPSCQSSTTCTAGAKGLGESCAQTSVCSATHADPICLPSFLGFAGGYCSEFCDLSADDCPGDGVCFDYGIGTHGICLDGCTSADQCRAGYGCVDLGLSSRACYIAPESACENYVDDDFDGLTDCDDPDCQATASCVPGAGGYGAPCSSNTQCASASGDDPLCLRNPPFFFPSGYCSEFCNVATSDCGPGGLCFDWYGLDGTTGQCFKRCATDADCSGGSCVDHGFGRHCNL